MSDHSSQYDSQVPYYQLAQRQVLQRESFSRAAGHIGRLVESPRHDVMGHSGFPQPYQQQRSDLQASTLLSHASIPGSNLTTALREPSLQEPLDYRSLRMSNPQISAQQTSTSSLLSFGAALPQIQYDAETFFQQGHHFLHVVRPRNEEMAFNNYLIAANLGSRRAKHQVAYCFQHGYGVEKDERRAFSLFHELSTEANPSASTLNQLGICYQFGTGVTADHNQAYAYYSKAVELGHRDAMFNLAYCLRMGVGSEIDYEAALNMYQRLASTGDAQGMKMVGSCKAAGLGSSVNEAEALEFFKRSNESDIYWCGKVQYALYLLNGIACEKDTRKGFRIMRDVCHTWPCVPGPNKVLLGRCYHFGVGCKVNLAKALYWYERAMKSYYMEKFDEECEMLIEDVRQKMAEVAGFPYQ